MFLILLLALPVHQCKEGSLPSRVLNLTMFLEQFKAQQARFISPEVVKTSFKVMPGTHALTRPTCSRANTQSLAKRIMPWVVVKNLEKYEDPDYFLCTFSENFINQCLIGRYVPLNFPFNKFNRCSI